MEIKLKKPIEKDDKIIEIITLNLENLKGADIVQAEKEARLQGDISADPIFSAEGLSIVAAKTSGIIVDDIKDLAAPDFLNIINSVRNFLYGWDSTPSKQ
jgi:hypothetical protein